MFNSIVNEFNIQISELDLKDDYLRREVIRKIEEVNKLNTELEQIIKNKQTVLTELQNVTLKLNEFKAFLASISTDMINKNENIIKTGFSEKKSNSIQNSFVKPYYH